MSSPSCLLLGAFLSRTFLLCTYLALGWDLSLPYTGLEKFTDTLIFVSCLGTLSDEGAHVYISFINLTHPNKLLWLALKEPTSQKLNIFMIKMKWLEIMKLLFFLSTAENIVVISKMTRDPTSVVWPWRAWVLMVTFGFFFLKHQSNSLASLLEFW